MPSPFGTAFVPQHSQASMQPPADTDRTRQILEVFITCCVRFRSLCPLLATLHFRLVLLKFNTSFRIAVVNGIWSEGDFFLTDKNYCTNRFEAHLSAFSLLSVIRGVKSRSFTSLLHVILRVFLNNRCRQLDGSWNGR